MTFRAVLNRSDKGQTCLLLVLKGMHFTIEYVCFEFLREIIYQIKKSFHFLMSQIHIIDQSVLSNIFSAFIEMVFSVNENCINEFSGVELTLHS